MNKKYILVCICIVILFSSSAKAISLTATPNNIDIKVGDEFTVDLFLSVDELYDTVAIDLLTFNSDVINLLSVSKGSLFSSYTIWLPGTIDNNEGTLTGVCGASSAQDVDGVFISLTFEVTDFGSSSIIVEHLGVAKGGVNIGSSPLHSLNVGMITVENENGNGGTSPPPSPPIPPDEPEPPVDDPVDDDIPDEPEPPDDDKDDVVEPPDDDKDDEDENLFLLTFIILVVSTIIIYLLFKRKEETDKTEDAEDEADEEKDEEEDKKS